MNRRGWIVGASFATVLVALGACQGFLDSKSAGSGPTVQAPVFEVDPLWPKPMPNHWLLGMTIGVWADEPWNCRAYALYRLIVNGLD